MALGIIFEIAIVLVLAIALIKGYRKGLFLLVTKPFGFFISFGLAILIYREIKEHVDFSGSRLIVFVAALILSSFLFRILTRNISKIFDIGFIGKINRLFGAILSIFVAWLFIWAFVSLTDYFMRLNVSLNDDSFKAGRLFAFFLETSPFDLLRKY